MKIHAADIARLATLCVAQCCSLKIEDERERVWLCRVGGGVTVERYNESTGRWEVVSGSCYALEARAECAS